MLVQERLKGVDLLTYSLQVNQNVYPERIESAPTCTSYNLSLPTINSIPAYR